MGKSDAWVAVTSRFYNWREGLGDGPGDVVALIAERPVSIVIVRDGTTLAAQTVRVDLDSRMLVTRTMGRGVSSSLVTPQKIILIGYKNATTGIVDTDLQPFDRFKYSDQYFTIKKVEMGFTDRLLAEAEADG